MLLFQAPPPTPAAWNPELLRNLQSSQFLNGATSSPTMVPNLELAQRIQAHMMNLQSSGLPNMYGNQTAPMGDGSGLSLLAHASAQLPIPGPSGAKRGRPGNGEGKRTPASSNVAKDEFGKVKLGPNGKPMVVCEICNKELADPSSLYRHRKIHTGEKPHNCPFCEKKFIQRYSIEVLSVDYVCLDYFN